MSHATQRVAEEFDGETPDSFQAYEKIERQQQLENLAADPNPDISEPAKSDLFREFERPTDVQ